MSQNVTIPWWPIENLDLTQWLDTSVFLLLFDVCKYFSFSLQCSYILGTIDTSGIGYALDANPLALPSLQPSQYLIVAHVTMNYLLILLRHPPSDRLRLLEFDNSRYVPVRDCFYIRTITITGVRSRDPSYSISTRFTYLYIVWTVWLKA